MLTNLGNVKKHPWRMVAFVGIFLTIIIIVWYARAAGPNAAVESETGSATGNIQNYSQNTASSGGLAQFGNSCKTSGFSNPTFWYQAITDSTDLSQFGCPNILVVNTSEVAALPKLHQLTKVGVFAYVQWYYVPESNPNYYGIDGTQVASRGWAFCNSGTTPEFDTLVKPTDPGKRWYYLDNNEAAVANAIKQYMILLKSQGFDGIFLDIGNRALKSGFWDKQSSCTNSPIATNWTSSDSYENLLKIAREVGIKTFINAGAPDSQPALRPDPRNSGATLNDVVNDADYLLHEGASNQYDDTNWLANTSLLSSDEHFSRGRAQLVAMGAYRGPKDSQVTKHIIYQWSISKLYNISSFIGTGTDRCGESWTKPMPAECNRGGIAPPALTNSNLGVPVDTTPQKFACESDGWHCVWVRRYSGGMVLVNNTATQKASGSVQLLSSGECRVVKALPSGKLTVNGTCTRSVNRGLPAFSAEVLVYK